MRYRYLGLLALPFLFSGNAARAQDEDPPLPASAVSTITVRTNIVGITALVRGKSGDLVRNLDKTDFTVKEDGKPIAIKYFDKDSDLPLQIGLLIDTSGSQKEFFPDQVKASEIFLHSMLTRHEDKAFIVRFDGNVLLLQNLTDDQKKLQTALGLLSKQFPQAPGNYAGTRLYDAIVATAQQVIGKDRGRRAVIVLTDGEDNGSLTTMENAMAMAQKADVAVYTILYSDNPGVPEALSAGQQQGGGGRALSGRVVMDRISLASGGKLFVVYKGTSVETIFQKIELDMRSQYRLGYVPKQSASGSYHKLEVKSNVKGLQVQARVGYYTP